MLNRQLDWFAERAMLQDVHRNNVLILEQSRQYLETSGLNNTANLLLRNAINPMREGEYAEAGSACRKSLKVRRICPHRCGASSKHCRLWPNSARNTICPDQARTTVRALLMPARAINRICGRNKTI